MMSGGDMLWKNNMGVGKVVGNVEYAWWTERLLHEGHF